MTLPCTNLLVISPNLWFRKSFGQYAKLAYADAEIGEQSDYDLNEKIVAQHRLIIVDVAGASSGLIHRLPGQHLDNIESQTESLTEQKWVAVIPYANDEICDSLLFAGYNGVIVKAVPPQTIIHSFEMLSKGEIVRPAPSNSMETNSIPEDIVNLLTQQELDLYRLLLKGSSIASIARELSISEKECVVSARRIMNSIRHAGMNKE